MPVSIKSIGRSVNCDYVVEDSTNKLSRIHAEVQNENGMIFLTDKSQNGIWVNNQRILPNQRNRIHRQDRVLLYNVYPVDLSALFSGSPSTDDNDDQTKILGSGTTSAPQIPFKIIGRSADAQIRLPQTNVSSYHCQIRLINEHRFELVDLNSANGTTVNSDRLLPDKIYQFPIDAEVKLAGEVKLNLKKCLGLSPDPVPPGPGPNPPTPQESAAFAALEQKFKEFEEWQRKPGKIVNSYSVGGTILGATGFLAARFLGPDGAVYGAISMTIGGVLGRVIGQKKADKMREDVDRRNTFLLEYACPRCKTSFQHTPWIIIQQCQRCKVNFR